MKGPLRSRPPKVFVSYSHDSQAHMERVRELCDRLRQDGIDAEVDQYEPAPAEGWPRWTARQIQGADFVLLICTETFRRRFEVKEKPGHGLGVVWEGGLVTQELYEAAGSNAKFIPVIFSRGDKEHIPGPLRGVNHYLIDT